MTRRFLFVPSPGQYWRPATEIMLRLKTLFPDDWEHILDVYREYASSAGGTAAGDDLLLMIIEAGVRFGERLSQLPGHSFLEVCCGLGIPSLTYSFLSRTSVRALDIDPKILSFAEDLKDRLGCDVEFECRDVFEDRPELREGEMVVAEKPASYKKNTLEVEYTIRNWCAIGGHGLALIPSFLGEDTPTTYSERCVKYGKKLKQVGFKVESERVFEPLPYRWIIATK